MAYRERIVASMVLALSLSCRSRGEGTVDPSPSTSAPTASGRGGPVMPAGLLAGAEGAPGAAGPSAGVKERLELARDKTAGEWAELQVTGPDERTDRTKLERWRPDSRFLSMDAMTLLHDAFARANPGFDLLLPRFFDTAAIVRLEGELARLSMEIQGLPRSAALQRWSGASDLVRGLRDEAAWLEARAALVATLGELGRFLKAVEAKKGTMWVLGM